MNTGGPAFPGTLLDWMAGQALAGSLASQSKESHWAFAPVEYETADDRATQGIAALCYDIAEAMLAEKARREGESDSGVRTAQSDDGATVEYVIADSSTGKRMAKLEALNRELAWALDIVLFGWVDAHDDAEEVVKARAILAKAKGIT